MDAAKLLRRAKREGTPLVERDTATFVWEGADAPHLIGDFNSWGWRETQMLEQVAPNVWTHQLTLPRDAYVEYAYQRDHTRVRDPLNPTRVPNAFDSLIQSFYMPDAVPTPLAVKDPRVTLGTVTHHVVRSRYLTSGNARTVHLYHPPTVKACPLLVVFDGQDYLEYAKLPTIVDNLIAQGRIPPIAMAMPDHGGKTRIAEYTCDDNTVHFILAEVLPLARDELNLVNTKNSHGAAEGGVLGASMGGLISLYTALRAPEIFGKVLSQSGAFGGRGQSTAVFELIEGADPRSPKIWMDAGKFEWLRLANEGMHTLLKSRGYDVTYREYSGGHNYTAWRNDVWRGLELMFHAAEN